MDVKKFIGMCAERNREVIIRDEFGFPITKGTIIDIFDSKFTLLAEHMTCEELLKREVYCFFFSNEKLYITLKEPK